MEVPSWQVDTGLEVRGCVQVAGSPSIVAGAWMEV